MIYFCLFHTIRYSLKCHSPQSSSMEMLYIIYIPNPTTPFLLPFAPLLYLASTLMCVLVIYLAYNYFFFLESEPHCFGHYSFSSSWHVADTQDRFVKKWYVSEWIIDKDIILCYINWETHYYSPGSFTHSFIHSRNTSYWASNTCQAQFCIVKIRQWIKSLLSWTWYYSRRDR